MSNRSRCLVAIRELVLAICALPMIHALSACAAPAEATTRETSARVIVRFAPGPCDPTDAASLARLASTARVTRLEPIRPMSGNAYVMTLVCPVATSDVDACDAAIARIAANPAVASIERDAKVRLP